MNKPLEPHNIKPHNTHPMLWCLTQVLGIKDIDINKATNIDNATLHRIRNGIEPTDHQKFMFATMLEESLKQLSYISNKSSPLRKLNIARREYIRYILDQHSGGLI